MTKSRLLAAIFAGILTLNPAFAAGGSHVGNGGNSVVCFSIPLDEAMHDGVITAAGSSHILSAEVLELYLALLKTGTTSPFLRDLRTGMDDQAISDLKKTLSLLPDFARDLKSIEKRIGKIEDGFGSPVGLPKIEDVVLPVNLPPRCALVQTVVRQDDTLYYDRSVWKALGQAGKIEHEILQLHEEIYFMAEKNQHAISSLGTQLFLDALMADPLTDDLLAEKLARYGIGTYVARSREITWYMDLRSFCKRAIAEAQNADGLMQLQSDVVDFPERSPLSDSLWTEGMTAAYEDLRDDVAGLVSINSRPNSIKRSEDIQKTVESLRMLLAALDATLADLKNGI